MSKKILICIPTYNEKDNVLPLAQAVFDVAKNWQGRVEPEILFIDDGSPDGTGKLCDQLAAKNSSVHVMHRSGKMGLATAYIQGFEWALAQGEKYTGVMEMDADFSHDPPALSDFFFEIDRGFADGISGSRYVEGGGVENWSEFRYLLSRAGSIYSRFWLSFDLNDWTGGFNYWSRQTLLRLDLGTIRSKGYAFQIELKYRTLLRGLRLVEIPIVFKERRSGASKMSGSIVKEALWGVIVLRLKST